MANRLLRYEAALFRRSFATAFGTTRDIALLIVVAALALLWLQDAGARGGLSLPAEAAWLAALAGPAAFSWQRLLAGRLRWMIEQSVLAADALHAGARRVYLGVAHVLLAIPLTGAILLLGGSSGRIGPAVLIGAFAFAAGIGLAAALGESSVTQRLSNRSAGSVRASPRSGTAAVIDAVLRRQTRSRGRPRSAAALIVAANFILTVAASWWVRDGADAVRMAAVVVPSLAVLAVAARTDSALIGFLPFAGYRPLFIAGAVSALPAMSFVAAATALLVTGARAGTSLIVLALLHFLFVLVAVERAWLAPGRDPRSVDLQVQIELGGLIVVAILLPPLAPAALVWRLWQHCRHNRKLLWTMP